MATNITYAKGNVMPYTNAGSAITSGTAVLVGSNRIGIAIADIAASGGTGNLAMECVVSYAKLTGASTGGAQGAKAYWNAAGAKFTAVSSGNVEVGYFWQTCADGDATCQVKLLG